MSLRISVIGTNYLGAAHAAAMAEFGHRVIGVDVVASRVAALNAGRSPVFEDGLEPLLRKHVQGIAGSTDRLRFTTDYDEIADWADVHFICVGTPQGDDGSADLTEVRSVIETLAPRLTTAALVVGKSTVPVGTARTLQQRLDAIVPSRERVEVVWNPEFLREAHAVADSLRPDRIVLGAQSPAAIDLMRRVYAIPISEDTPVIECDLQTAELIKAAANSFLATKISFINAMARMCQAAGGDVARLADALGHDRRIGREYLNAGLGFGGGCLPKDVRALAVRAAQLGVGELSDLLGSVEAINAGQRTAIADLAVAELGGDIRGRTVAVLGAAFKPGTDDTRDSPALTVARDLAARGGDVRVYDPQAEVGDGLLYAAGSVREALADAELVLHLTEWEEFRQLEPAEYVAVVTNPLIIDARLKLDRHRWTAAGWKVVQPGRATTL